MTEPLPPLLDPILVVEDDPGTAALLKRILGGEGWEVATVGTGREALDWLGIHRACLLLLDNSLPDMNAGELAEQMELPPFVVITGGGSERLAVRLMKLGARDYLVKDSMFLDSIGPAVRRVLREVLNERRLAEAEEAHRRAEEQYRALVESLDDVLFSTDAEGRFTYLSPVAEKLFARPLGELALEPLFQLAHPGDLARLQKSFGDTLRGELKRCEFRLPPRAGEARWARMSARPVILDGRVAGVRGLLTDITDRRRAEDALRRQKDLMEAIFEGAPNAMLLVDRLERLVGINARGEALARRVRGDVLGQPLGLALGCVNARPGSGCGVGQGCAGCALHRQATVAFTPDAQALEGEGRLRLALEGGEDPRHLLVSAVRMPGEEEQVLLTLVDITERQRAEEDLRETHRRLALAQRSSGAGFWTWDIPAGRVAWTPELKAIFGLAGEAEESFELWRSVVLPEDLALAEARIMDAVRDRHGLESEYRVRWSTGEIRWILATGLAEYDDEGRPVRMSGLCMDITERRAAQEERRRMSERLAQSQKLEALGVLTAGISHDLNNVMGAILGMSSAREMQAAGEDRRAFQVITTACKRGRDVLAGLLRFSRSTLSTPAPLELGALVAEVAQLLDHTSRKRVEVEARPSGRPLWIQGDAAGLSHALVNLCLNAFDAMPEGGRLTLSASEADPGQAEIVVEDTGAGMPPEILERALEPFFTTKEQGKGTGLGLSMAYGVVKAHAGRMELESRPGQGTRVVIRLPLAAEPPGSTAILEAAGPPPRLFGGEVFLVDDEELVRLTMVDLLGIAGYRVWALEDGPQLLERLQAGERPGVVILDMNMPRMNGLETLARLREICPDLPVLVASGQPDVEEFPDLQRPGVGILRKPFALDEILAALARLQELSPQDRPEAAGDPAVPPC